MKIVFSHAGILPVKKYGGIERMLFWHMKELVKQGHEVVLIGHPESQVQSHGIQLISNPTNNFLKDVPKGADLIQLFYGGKLETDIPVVYTVGGNGQPGEVFEKNTVFVSKKHAQNHGSESFVYNALDLDEYPFRPKEKQAWNDFLFLAKASWKVKNLKHCVSSCRSQSKNLHIAGGKSWWPSKWIHNYGKVGGEEKLSIIRRSDALLFPVRWQEPFGLAIIEAMTQGIPVIGSPYGSLPELIKERMGLIVEDQEQLREALVNPPTMATPDEIRSYVEENYSISQFTKSYIEIFKKVLSGQALNQTKPQWRQEQTPETLLSF